MTLLDDARSPLIAVQRGVACKAHVDHGGQCGEAVFDLTVKRGDAFGGVAGTLRIESQDVTIGRLDAEVLMLEVGK